MPKYRVLQPLQHNQETLQEGETVEMTQKQAAFLLEMKAIAPLGASTESTPSDADPMIVTQQVSNREPTEVDPKTAPPSMAKKQREA